MLAKNNRILAFIAIIGFVGAFSFQLFAQDPSQKPIKQKKEKSTIEKWASEEGSYILTSEEQKAIKLLKTDEERENFIETVWRRLDPDPDTEENEFREQFYERIAYANEHFTSGTPGWKTDRGRIYIKWGKPDSIESHPSGGSYDRPSYEGGGSTTTYPFEIWFYRNLDSVGNGIEIEFVDPSGTGEYRIARDADEKDALAKIPGAGLKTAELLGLSSKAERGLNSQAGYMRAQDNPFVKQETINSLLSSTPARSSISGITIIDSPRVEDMNPIEFDVQIDMFRQSDDRVIAAFTLQTNNKELTFNDEGGLQVAKMNIYGRITAVSGKRSGVFEDAVSTTATVEELTEIKSRKSVYQKAYALAPGNYKIDIIVRDIEGGNKGVKSIGFAVPKYDNEKLATSTLILASRLNETTENDIGGRFVIGDKKVIPNLTGVYKRGQDVGVYLQVYNAGIDQTTLRPSADVEYLLVKDGKEVLKITEDWLGLGDAGQRLTLAKILPTAGLAPGEYEIKIRIKDAVKNQMLEPTKKFVVVQ